MIWLLLYAAALAASCFYHAEKHGGEQFFLYGRMAGAPMVCLSMLASRLGGSATIGMIGLAWQTGFPAIWWLGAGACGLAVLAFFLAEKVRRSRAWTMPEIVARPLGSLFRKFAAVIIFFAYLAIMAAQFAALRLLISSLAGLSDAQALVFGVALVFFYTCLGGQGAVMRSDVWQFVIMVAMLALLLAFCLMQPEGRLAIAHMKWELVNSEFPPAHAVYFLLILGGSFVVGPMLFGRILSAKSAASAKRGVWAASAGLFALALLITLIGVAIRGYPLANAMAGQQIFGEFVTQHLPRWAGIAVLLGMLSVIISSADSCLLTVGTVCASDLLGKPTVACCRLVMALVSGLSLWLASQGRGILDLLLMANDIYVCGLVVPVFVTIFAEGKKPLNRKFIFCAMLVGGGAGFCAALLAMQWLSFSALGIALLFSLLALLPGRGWSSGR